jgi:DEAD/DEAH box helicase domain-containing protein
LVLGVISAPPSTQVIDADRLVVLSAGNARLIRLQNELDGPAAGFGTRFWTGLEKADPLIIATLKQNAVSKVVYRDRYLLTPLNFRLLHEVLAALPGRLAGTNIEITTAQLDRVVQASYQAYHPYPNDQNRRAVLERLFPRAKISVLPKAQQPHARSFELKLNDGRCVLLLLDKGFGAWRADGTARHDFRDSPDKQAMKIKQADIRLRMGERQATPIVIEIFDPAFTRKSRAEYIQM